LSIACHRHIRRPSAAALTWRPRWERFLGSFSHQSLLFADDIIDRTSFRNRVALFVASGTSRVPRYQVDNYSPRSLLAVLAFSHNIHFL